MPHSSNIDDASSTISPIPGCAGCVAELAAHRRFAPAGEPQLHVELRGEARALGLEGAFGLGGTGSPALPGLVSIDLAPTQPADDPAELPRPVASSSRCSILAAIVGVGLLVASSSAGAANSLPAAPEARFVTSAPAGIDHRDVPSYAGRCEPARRCGEEYVFAATRSLRQPGIDPAVAVVLAPATLVLDVVFFPFALALDGF